MKAHVLNHFTGAMDAIPATQRPTVGLLGRLVSWLKVSRERERLGHMSERLLRDIGIDRGIANTEAGRPFWDMPAGRRDLN